MMVVVLSDIQGLGKGWVCLKLNMKPRGCFISLFILLTFGICMY